MKTQFSIHITDEKIEIHAPYCATNNKIYRSRGGKFNKAISAWEFPNSAATHTMIEELWGTDTTDGLVTIEIAEDDENITDTLKGSSEWMLGGYLLASRQNRDEAVRMPDGVQLAKGSWKKSGGSQKNPAVTGDDIVLHVVVRKSFAERESLKIIAEEKPAEKIIPLEPKAAPEPEAAKTIPLEIPAHLPTPLQLSMLRENLTNLEQIPKLPPVSQLLKMSRYDDIWKDAPVVEADPAMVICKQSRETMNFQKVDDYREDMEAGIRYDPCFGIIDENGTVYTSDGMHRTESAKQAKVTLDIKVLRGTEKNAEFLASGANVKHGIPREQADKQRSVKMAMLDPDMYTQSNRAIARWCGVDEGTIRKYRKELETSKDIPKTTTREVTRTVNGKQQSYQVEVPGTENFTVQELENDIRGTLHGSRQDKITYLQDLVHNTVVGQAYLREIEESLRHEGQRQGKKYRKSDLNKAIRNLLNEILQVQCSGKQEDGQHCEFIGTEDQMFQHHDKWYCSKCFAKIQKAQKPQQPQGDPGVLDNLILKLIPGDMARETLRSIGYDREYGTEFAKKIPGFPVSAIQERCRAMLNKLDTPISETEKSNTVLCDQCQNPLPAGKPLVECLDPETEKLLCDECWKKKEAQESEVAAETETPETEAGQQHPTAIGMSIEELEQELADNWFFPHNDREKALESLRMIKAKHPGGQHVLSNVYNQLKEDGRILPGQKHDIRQACWNLLERLEAKQPETEQSEAESSSEEQQSMTEAQEIGERTKQLLEERGITPMMPVAEEEEFIGEFWDVVERLSEHGLHELQSIINTQLNERGIERQRELLQQQTEEEPGDDEPTFDIDNLKFEDLIPGRSAMPGENYEKETESTTLLRYHYKDKIIEVRKGIGDEPRYMTMYQKPNGSWKRVVSPALKIHDTQEDAQTDLDAFAQNHNLTAVTEKSIPEPIDAEEAAHILKDDTPAVPAEERIITLKQEGMSTRSIAQTLKDEDYVNEHTGKPWSKSAVDRVIQNARKEGVEV